MIPGMVTLNEKPPLNKDGPVEDVTYNKERIVHIFGSSLEIQEEYKLGGKCQEYRTKGNN